MRTFTQKPKTTQLTASTQSLINSRAYSGHSYGVSSGIHRQGNKIGENAIQGLPEPGDRGVEGDLQKHSIRFAHDFSRMPARVYAHRSVQPKPKTGRSADQLWPEVQTKRAVDQPGDRYEREADAAAERVMAGRTARQSSRFPLPSGGPSHSLKLKRAEGIGERRVQQLREKTSGDVNHLYGPTDGLALPTSVAAVTQASGSPLESRDRAYLETRFGHDFGRVRVHQDAAAAGAARQIHARAYTWGEHIAFASGQYQPNTKPGRSLLAHELAHVLQQRERTPRIQRFPWLLGCSGGEASVPMRAPSNPPSVEVTEARTAAHEALTTAITESQTASRSWPAQGTDVQEVHSALLQYFSNNYTQDFLNQLIERLQELQGRIQTIPVIEYRQINDEEDINPIVEEALDEGMPCFAYPLDAPTSIVLLPGWYEQSDFRPTRLVHEATHVLFDFARGHIATAPETNARCYQAFVSDLSGLPHGITARACGGFSWSEYCGSTEAQTLEQQLRALGMPYGPCGQSLVGPAEASPQEEP